MLSLALRLVIATVNELDVEGRENDDTLGAVVSARGMVSTMTLE